MDKVFKKSTLNKLNKSNIFIRSLYLSKLEKLNYIYSMEVFTVI